MVYQDNNVFIVDNNYVLNITYKSSKGEITEREIEIESIDTKHKIINAFCRLRNMARTFRIDRIQTCYDAKTGEFIKRDDIINYLKFVKHETWSKKYKG